MRPSVTRCLCGIEINIPGESATTGKPDWRTFEWLNERRQSVARGDLDLGKLGDEAVTQDQEKRQGEYKNLLEHMQNVLKERASGVRVTHRLTDSPACLVSDEQGMSMNLERLLKASGQKGPTHQACP
jgi:molecular chaperone HtpG